MKELLAEVDSGSGLSGRQKAFHERTRLRDSALLALMLGTGIRVSECVGLNLDDVDMKESGIHIRRKGGKETTVYFNAEVARRLNEYIAGTQKCPVSLLAQSADHGAERGIPCKEIRIDHRTEKENNAAQAAEQLWQRCL